MRKLIIILNIFFISIFMWIGPSSAASRTDLERFALAEKPVGAQSHEYSAPYFGGYHFSLSNKWKNVSNINAQKKLNVITFVLASDETQSLTLIISKTSASDIGKPLDAQKRLVHSLSKKGIAFDGLNGKHLMIGNDHAEWAEASLKNGQFVRMLFMDRNGLSLTGTLGHAGPDSEVTEDLFEIFKNFSINSGGVTPRV